MELKRKIEKVLLEWKNSPLKKPLIVRGPRQCGKTHSVLKFAREHYRHVVYINFFESPDMGRIFDGSLQVDDILFKLSLRLKDSVRLVPHETVIIFDEIQDCPEARTSLKFWKIDGRFDVICTGSLLGVKGYGKEPRSIPVGYENHLTMHPLDFEEFLWAIGVPEPAIARVREEALAARPFEKAVHEAMRANFLLYAAIGGMPEAVTVYCKHNDMRLVRQVQTEIVDAYKSDMIKYAEPADRARITECFESIPAQLGKENKKFQYALVRKGSKASTYAGSLQWIEDAGITMRCYNVSLPEVPFEGVLMRDVFKVYMNDPGLFVSLLGSSTPAEILSGNLSIYKGAVYENLMAGVLHKLGFKLFYFRKENGVELDFLVSHKGRCVPIEIKSTTGNSKSLASILKNTEKYHITRALKFGDYNCGETPSIRTMPLYTMFLLPDLLAV